MSKLHAIQPIQPIREAVYEQLKMAILSGVYDVNERLLLKGQVARFRHVSLSGPERRESAYYELDALKAHDPERASELMHIHIRNALTAYFNSKSNRETR